VSSGRLVKPRERKPCRAVQDRVSVRESVYVFTVATTDDSAKWDTGTEIVLDNHAVAFEDAGVRQLQLSQEVSAMNVNACIVKHELRIGDFADFGQKPFELPRVSGIVEADGQFSIEVAFSFAKGKIFSAVH
jgi:hypothetical protein